MPRVEVEEALRAWRVAERALQDAPADGPAHRHAEKVVAERRLLYQRAVLGSRGRTDALDAASEMTRDRLIRSYDLIARSQDLTRVDHRGPDDQERDGAARGDAAARDEAAPREDAAGA